MTDQTIKIVLTATGDAQVSAAATRAAKGLDQLDASHKKVAVSAAQAANAQRMLAPQLTDIAVGLSTGQSPFTVLLQQGGQLKDMFGGIGPAAKAVGGAVLGMLSPINLAVAAVAALGYAAYQGMQQSDALANSLRLTGGFAGQTAGQLEAMTQRLQASTGSSIGNVRELTAGLVATGQYGPQSIGAVVSAMARLQTFTGQSAAEVLKDFDGMSGGVAKWAAEHNKAYHFLSIAQFAHIQQLERQGKLEEAMRTTASALDGALAARAPQLGLLEKAWKALGDTASKAWDDMKGIGRAETVEQQIAKVQAELTANARRTDRADSIGPNGPRRGADAQAAELKARIEGLQELQRIQNRAATEQGEQARKDQTGINKLMDTGAQGRAMQAQLATLQEQLKMRQEIYKAGETEVDALQKTGLLNEVQATEQKAVIRARSIEDERETVARRLAILKQYNDTQKDQATAQGEALVLQVRAEAQAAQAQEAIHQAAYQRFEAGNEQYSKIVDNMRSLTERVRDANANGTISLISDPQARAVAQYRQDLAQLEREISEQRRKGTFDLVGGDELQRQMEQQRDILGAKLVQSLKPEWQTLVEGWRDTTRLMREASDEMTLGFVRGSEDAFVKMARTGKLNLNSLRDEITNTFLRTAFRSTLGDPAAKAGQWLSGALLGNAGGKKKSDSQDKTETALDSLASKAGDAAKGLGEASTTSEVVAKLMNGFAGSVSNAGQSLISLIAGLSGGGGGGGTNWFGLAMSAYSAYSGAGAVGAASQASSAVNSNGSYNYSLAGSQVRFGKPNALGSIYGSVREFARGSAFTNGIVSSPTNFRFAHGGGFGLGLMGEAGPEAIMPLKRTSTGALGVQVAGGSTAPSSVQINLGGVSIGAGVSVSEMTAGLNIAIDAAQARVLDSIQRGNRAFDRG